MKIKTIKLNEGDYTDFGNTFDEHDLVILSGARGSGKSYPVAKYVSKILEKDEEAKFVYMRISKDELPTFAGWCSDLNLQKIAGSEKVILERGKPTAGDILLKGLDGEDKIIYERVIGKCMSLEKAATFKSGKYIEYKAIVFEEFARLKMNPANEKTYAFHFFENVESIFRGRQKKIFMMCNNLKTIPLLETGIDKKTGEASHKLFKNPVKYKIFRKMKNPEELDEFTAYLNGELFTDDDFKVNIDEFFTIYTNKNYILKQHKVYPRKHYVMANKNRQKIHYHENEYLILKYFCQAQSVNEFYYQNTGIERAFTEQYQEFLRELTKFLSDSGSRFIMPY